MSDKPKNLIDNLNKKAPFDVEVSNEKLPGVRVFKNRLKLLGTQMQSEMDSANRRNFEYAGSVVTHFYIGKQLSDTKGITLIHDHAFVRPLSEQVVSMGVSDLALHLMQNLFGRKKAGTRDARDKRQKGIIQ